MTRRTLLCLCAMLLFVPMSFAADAFIGTWTADMEKMRAEIKKLPPGALGDTFKVEAWKSGYKITHSAGKYVVIMTVDFKTGTTAVRDAQGREIDRAKVERKSATEIVSTSLVTGNVFDYRILPGGREIEITVSNRKNGKPPARGYYKRAG